MISTELILHYVWKFKLFSFQDLNTADGEPIVVKSVGISNADAGPDFLNAKIQIGDTLWAGNVEIHIKSSDWLNHHHQTDKGYDNVILHVVWENDVKIYRTDGTLIPTLELKDKVDQKIIDNYELLKQNNYWIPCEKQFASVDELTKQQCLDRMMLERLEKKSDLIKSQLDLSKGGWEDTFYVILAKSFGFKVNAIPFELLAKQLPQKILAKHKNVPLQIEALLFGTAGLLERNFKDDYPNALKTEFQFLKQKYQLEHVRPELWKFSKTRPDNFPSVRLSQFAGLVFQSQHLFSKIIALKNYQEFYAFFKEIPINSYWKNHFQFDKEVENRSIQIGKSSVDVIIINAIVPLLFLYGNEIGDQGLIDIALKMLENMKPEQNKIVKGFEERGYKSKHASDSQALIHLKKFYCDEKKCLNCGIGLKILRSN